MGTFHKPTKLPKVTCKFGTKGGHWQCGHHTGTDYAGQIGDPVYAIAGGEIIHSGRMHGWGLSYGIHVVIKSQNTSVGDIEHLYGHLSYVNLPVIAKGKVEAGDIIGYVGITGNATTGPHLHLEVRKAPYLYNNKCIDPESLFKPAVNKK